MQYSDRGGLNNKSFSESDLLRPYHSDYHFKSPTRSTLFQKSEICPFPVSPVVITRSLLIEELVPLPLYSEYSKRSLKGYSSEVINASSCQDVHMLYNSSVVSNTRVITPLDFNNISTDVANLQINKTDDMPGNLKTNPKEMEDNTAMDVDECDNYGINTNTFNQPITSALDHVLRQRQVIKHFNGKISKNGQVLLNNDSSKKKQFNGNFLKLIFVILSLYAVYVIFSDHIHLYINDEFQIENLQKELLKVVHDQVGAVNTILTSLRYKAHWKSSIKLLGFIGPSGVGKTFVANVIKRNFMYKLVHEIYGYHLNNFSLKEKILQNIWGCCFNLIIVDDIQRHGMVDLLNFVYSLPNNIDILVVAIFNIKENDDNFMNSYRFDDLLQVKNELDNTDIYQELIFFKPFTDGQVRSWLKKQLELHMVTLNMHNRIIRNTLEGHNVTNNGLKGLEKKMLLEIEKLFY